MQQYAMSSALANFLTETIEREIPNLRAITEEQSTLRRGEGKWCPREELGHLIDSASNNHIRFVRTTLDGEFRGPSYLADDWVRLHGYRDISWESIVALWLRFNKLLTTLVDRIPEDALHSPCYIGSGEPSNLGFVIEDYVLHMQHHLDLLFKRSVIMEYGIKPSS
jgi:hypothetical protein